MAPSQDSQALADVLSRVKAAAPPGGRWEWDARMECALTTLKKETEAQGRAALSASLPGSWTKATLGKAPALVQQVCEQTGGLKGAQMVFAAELEGVVAYCLWWPWGDGATFSARVGVVSADGNRDLLAGLRAAFGI